MGTQGIPRKPRKPRIRRKSRTARKPRPARSPRRTRYLPQVLRHRRWCLLRGWNSPLSNKGCQSIPSQMGPVPSHISQSPISPHIFTIFAYCSLLFLVTPHPHSDAKSENDSLKKLPIPATLLSSYRLIFNLLSNNNHFLE